MLKSLYEHEVVNKHIYDEVREYCIAEKVNEEYLRGSIRKIGLGSKPKNSRIIIALLILSIIGLGIHCTEE